MTLSGLESQGGDVAHQLQLPSLQVLNPSCCVDIICLVFQMTSL